MSLAHLLVERSGKLAGSGLRVKGGLTHPEGGLARGLLVAQQLGAVLETGLVPDVVRTSGSTSGVQLRIGAVGLPALVRVGATITTSATIGRLGAIDKVDQWGLAHGGSEVPGTRTIDARDAPTNVHG